MDVCGTSRVPMVTWACRYDASMSANFFVTQRKENNYTVVWLKPKNVFFYMVLPAAWKPRTVGMNWKKEFDTSSKSLPKFERLVLGCIDAEFCINTRLNSSFESS